MMKFNDILEGKASVSSIDEMKEVIKQDIALMDNISDINDLLTKLHGSDAYYVITDIIKPQTNVVIQDAKNNDTEGYQTFQDIAQSAKKIFDYENKPAKIGDISNMVYKTQVELSKTIKEMYGIAVRMISVLDDEIGKIEVAVNRIEEHIGLDVTNFNKGDSKDDDNAEPINEQRVEEVAD